MGMSNRLTVVPVSYTHLTLDFAYHGGIYRDVWLINKKEISITNVIEADRRDAGIAIDTTMISKVECILRFARRRCV